MEPTSPMASLIGFDATLGTANAVNRGRRSTDPGNQRFAEVFDLAAYAASGSREAARVQPQRAQPLTQVLPAANAATLTVAHSAPAPTYAPAVEAAADRLFHHLTTGWNPGSGLGTSPLVLRLQDADGTQLAQRVVPAPHDDGPAVA